MTSVGYCITSHVFHNHIATPLLIKSMLDCGIEPEKIVVVVNGSLNPTDMVCDGITYLFRTPPVAAHLFYIAYGVWGEKKGITHWFNLNCTSKCGPKFKELVENGFDPELEAVSATDFILPCEGIGTGGRPINDLAMYRNDFLLRIEKDLFQMNGYGMFPDLSCEGLTFALANTKGYYPVLNRIVSDPVDIYKTGTPRITEYFPGIDWYRFKKNWGQMVVGEYDIARL